MRSPTHVFSHGQWWSKRETHLVRVRVTYGDDDVVVDEHVLQALHVGDGLRLARLVEVVRLPEAVHLVRGRANG